MINKYAYRILNLDFSSAKVNEPVEIEGQVITYLTGSPDITIRLNSRSNDAITISTKDRLKLPDNMSFKKFYITGSSGGGIIQLLVGSPDLMVDAGQVYIAGSVDSNNEAALIASLNGNHYTAGFYQDSSPTEYASVGLWNPVGSGLNLFIYKIFYGWGSAASTCHSMLTFINAITALTEDSANAYSSNIKAGGGVPTGVLVYGKITAVEFAAIQYGADQLESFFRMARAVNDNTWVDIVPSYCIPPGYGLLMRGLNPTASHNVEAAFHWIEKTL